MYEVEGSSHAKKALSEQCKTEAGRITYELGMVTYDGTNDGVVITKTDNGTGTVVDETTETITTEGTESGTLVQLTIAVFEPTITT